MKCPKCGGKGYIEDWYHYGDRARPMLRQCCDVSAYSARVQEIANFGAVPPQAGLKRDPSRGEPARAKCEVIPLRRT